MIDAPANALLPVLALDVRVERLQVDVEVRNSVAVDMAAHMLRALGRNGRASLPLVRFRSVTCLAAANLAGWPGGEPRAAPTFTTHRSTG